MLLRNQLGTILLYVYNTSLRREYEHCSFESIHRIEHLAVVQRAAFH